MLSIADTLRSSSTAFSIDDLLYCLVPLWPTSPQHEIVLTQLENRAEESAGTHKTIKGGVWKTVDEHLCPGDKDGWIIMHWPRILDALLEDGRTVDRVVKRISTRRTLRKALRESPDASETTWRTLRRNFESQLPAGAIHHLDTHFTTRIAFLARHNKNTYKSNQDLLDEFTVFRCGPLKGGITKDANRNLLIQFQDLQPYTFVNLNRINPLLIERGPVLIKILYHCMRQAYINPELNGWADLGLAWTRAGLIFNPHLAMCGVAKDAQLAASLGGITPPELLAMLADPDSFVHAHLPGFPGADRLIKAYKHAVHLVPKAIAPYAQVFEDQRWADARPYHNRESLLFPLKHGCALHEYFERLQKETLEPSKPLRPLLKPAVRVKKSRRTLYAESLNPKPKATHQRQSYLLQVSAWDLSYYPTVELPLPLCPFGKPKKRVDKMLAMLMAPYMGQRYMTFPELLQARFAELNMKDIFKSSTKSLTLAWHEDAQGQGYSPYITVLNGKPLLSAEKAVRVEIAFPKRTVPDENPATYNINATSSLLLHPAMFNPLGGEAWIVLDAILAHRPDANDEDRALAQAFRTLCMWVFHYDTDPLVHHRLAGEFEAMMDPACPIRHKLNNASERWDFLIDKAELSAKHIPTNNKLLGKHAHRSAAMTDYTKFLYWYVATRELEFMGREGKDIDGNPYRNVKLSREDQAKYITMRWIRWRTAAVSEADLVHPYPSPNYKKTPVKSAEDWDVVMAYASREFGMASTEV